MKSMEKHLVTLTKKTFILTKSDVLDCVCAVFDLPKDIAFDFSHMNNDEEFLKVSYTISHDMSYENEKDYQQMFDFSKDGLEIKGMSLNGIKLVLQDGQKEFERTCPKCFVRKPISRFGLRNMGDGTIRVQGECVECRSNK